MTELVLGTAQFGAGYGITNGSARLDDRTVSGILDAAFRGGVTSFDTAMDYGDSQLRLGELAPKSAFARYITKFSLMSSSEELDSEAVYGRSMRELRVAALGGVLLHRASDLVDERHVALLGLLRDARSNGFIEKIGVSIYDEAELELALEAFPDLDIIQLPASIVDRRLLGSELLQKASSEGVTIHARSAYLQGLLLAEPTDLGSYFQDLAPAIVWLEQTARDLGCSRAELLLAYVRSHPEVSGIVIGATSRTELETTLEAWNWVPPIDLACEELGVPERILDPRRWPAP